jgi:hypothetical protein
VLTALLCLAMGERLSSLLCKPRQPFSFCYIIVFDC